LSITYSVSTSGIVGISGNIEYLKSVTVEKGYTFMLPMVFGTLKDLVSSVGALVVSTGDGTIHYFSEDGDLLHSFAGVDSRNPNLITAMTVESPYKTLRMGEPNRGSNNGFFFLQNRSDYPKLYPSVYTSHITQIGEKYTFNGKYTIGDI